MRSSLPRTILALGALAGTASASVSLASFTPRIDLLPSQCATVYNARIDGCVAADFGSGATCSAACVQGLVKIAEAVLRSCANVDVGETSIIGVFQNGIGIQALCPKVTVTTIASTSTTRAPSQTTTGATTTSTEAEDDEPPRTSGGLLVDPSATGAFGTTANTQPTNTLQPVASSQGSNSAAQSSLVPNSQLSNADSGGGSPFDITATGSSPQLQAVGPTLAALVATALLFVACA